MPPAAAKRSDTGAKAFLSYYYALVKYGHATGDWTALKRLSQPSCSICKRFWEKDGGRLPSDDRPVVVRHVYANLRPQEDRAVGALGWGYGRLLAPPGKAQKEKPGHDWSDLVQMRYSDGRWTVESIRITKGN